MTGDKIPGPSEDLVFCDYKKCLYYGEYINCYFDLFENCDFYKWPAERETDLNNDSNNF